MPAVYAHQRFGREVLRAVPSLEKTVGENRPLFEIGLQGPDFLFFYVPMIPKNRINRIGYDAHDLSGRTFLLRGQRLLARTETPEKTRAYLYGLMCHFLLDSTCHPGVKQAMETQHVTHAAVETSFERLLLIRDGKTVLPRDPCAHFEITRENAAVMAPFFPPVLTDEVEKCLTDMVFYTRVLHTDNTALRFAIDKGLYITFHHDKLADMMMTRGKNPRCAQSDADLMRRFEAAVARAPSFFQEIDRFLAGGAAPGPDFDRNFDGM